MDLMLVIFLLCLTLMCAYLREIFEAALLALVVVYGVSMMGMLQWAVRSSVDLEKFCLCIFDYSLKEIMFVYIL